MAAWRVQLFGPLTVLRDGEPVKFRTSNQALLLAWLVAHGARLIDRDETAELLWPRFVRKNALAYLRRAVKELRDLGVGIRTHADGLVLDHSEMGSDLDDLRQGVGGIAEPGDALVLEGTIHPLADRIRLLVRRELAVPLHAYRDATTLHRPAPPGGDGTLEWLGDALLAIRPALALEIVSRHADYRFHDNPPERVLALLLRILRANPAEDAATAPDRLRVLIVASHNALLLTHNRQAEELALLALDEARAQGNRGGEARALSALTSVLRETAQWDRAVERGREAVAVAGELDDPAAIAHARDDLASVLLHRASFDEAAEQYRLGWEAIPGEWVRRVAHTNLVHLWAIYGTALPFAPTPYVPAGGSRVETGYSAWVEGCLEFSTGFGLGDMPVAVRGVQRMLAVTAGEGMERLLCVALDSAAFTFRRLGLASEAAACVRVGTRVRLRIGHPRSPGEKVAVRRHVSPPFFGPRIVPLVAAWDLDEIETMAARICARFPEDLGPAGGRVGG